LKTAPVLFFRGRAIDSESFRELTSIAQAVRWTALPAVPLCRLARYPPRRRTFPAFTRNDRIWRLCGPPWSRSARRN